MSEKYEAIKEFLKSEALKPESRTRMPTTRELMRRFNASQSPVSRAIRDLEKEGVLICRQGSGIVSCGARPRLENIGEINRRDVKGMILLLYVDYFSEHLWNIQHTCESYAIQLGYETFHWRMQHGDDRMAIIRQVMAHRTLNGIVLLPGADFLEPELLDFLGSLSIPVVIEDSVFSYAGVADNISVQRVDAVQCGEACARYFLSKGHRRAGFARNEPQCENLKIESEAFLRTMRQGGGQGWLFSSTIRSWENSSEAAAKLMHDSLATIREEGISALFFASSWGALAAMRELRLAGIRVPEEVGLLGAGCSLLLPHLLPALDSMEVDYCRMSRDAFDMICGNLALEPERLYAYRIIARESLITL